MKHTAKVRSSGFGPNAKLHKNSCPAVLKCLYRDMILDKHLY